MKRYSLLLLVTILQVFFFGSIFAQKDTKKQKLLKLAKENNGLVHLNSRSYSQFTEGRRNYGIVVLLTALDDRFRCIPCREFDPEYRLVASSYQKTQDPSRVFFGRLDFNDGQEIYQKLGLQTAPNVFYFPPSDSGAKKEPIRYDIARSGFTAETFAEFLTGETGATVPVHRPFDYFKAGVKIFMVLGLAASIKLAYAHLGFIIFHKNTWAAISIIIVLVMTSGHMWNRIRNPPYVMPGPNGKINYVANGFTQQLGMESQIVASMYGVLAFAVVSLAVSVPKFDDKLRQRIGVYIWMGCIIIVFSCLVNMFKLKNGSYPFSLLF
ncbi:uncharacterized protein BYT42DRAFT_594368 [Radiomyces spectabilis]|uniref:uncharacterized protein n=1 Tax=Radiomyces spectabilis TaxID=64574 RepID=UPI00221ED749|nr:uncharacterized protein BYT42DRAFT_594368 [Radiomyces spectabilis]KAI8376548.1 hypothetical protein BYT42DRAFT_594368 [Radiomyces spectabilis]